MSGALSTSDSVTIAALLIALVAACAAVHSSYRARRAFLVQNFLTVMEKMQSDSQRRMRGLLRARLFGEHATEQPIRWVAGAPTPESEAVEGVSQLLDQVGILVDERMVDRRAILNNWSVAIVEVFIVAAPCISDRRRRSPMLWQGFESLAVRASRRVPADLKAHLELARDRLKQDYWVKAEQTHSFDAGTEVSPAVT